MSIPSKEQAFQFAVMLQAGLPAAEAITYFVESDDPAELAAALSKWTRSREVKRAIAELMGKPWQEMTLDEKLHAAVDHHYAQLAYLLFSHNYVEVSQQDKAKLDTARQAIEAKLSGMAGKLDALSQFAADLNSGKLKLSLPSVKAN